MSKSIRNAAQTAAVITLAAALLAGCAVTEQRPVTQADMNCALLGPDCSKLMSGAKGQASLRYVNPAAKWSQYNQVIIEPVTFWDDDTTKYSTRQQQALVEYFQQSLANHLGKKFQVVNQPGPGVMKIQVAVVDFESATPVLRTISMVSPQARILSNIKYLVTDTFPFVGGAQAEGKITDAVSGHTLALAADRRIGGGAVQTGFQWKWGDAENVMDAWSEQMANRLTAWTTGAETP
ncbi:MAG: DUF3313 domain-containing protein [bacterium]